MVLANPTGTWTAADGAALYGLERWGDPYFCVSERGHVMVQPRGDRGGSLDLVELVQELQGRDLSLPLLIRFDDILEDRLERLHGAFERAIAQYGYGGRYQGVFPVKCNQQRHVVEQLVESGRRWHFGLEAGSKAELLIALSLLDDPEALLICNGYKDQRYIETAILARRLGRQPVVVIEQADEVGRIIAASGELGAAPLLGIRAKLSARSTGRWGSSVGERAKFGLSVPDLLASVEALRAADLLGELRLLHFHIGSQINDIAVLKDALQEAWNDALKFKHDALAAFRLGYLSLPERGLAEQLTWACCQAIAARLGALPAGTAIPQELQALPAALASTYYANLSVFRSAPDTWAIDQLFPVMPIQRLQERPDGLGSFADLTCDSDGKIARFIDPDGRSGRGQVKPLLELHNLRPGEPYLIGLFLGGAYQEVMGNLHNLFGSTNAVHLRLKASGGYQIDHVVRGDTNAEVLEAMEHDPQLLLERLRMASETAIGRGQLGISDARRLMAHLEASLRQTTYLQPWA